MILRFPDLDTLRLALAAAIVPDAVAMAPAVAGADDRGGIWVRPSASPSWRAQAELKRLGVQIPKKADVPLDEAVGCWPQLIPLRRDDAGRDPPGETTPVLFEVAGDQVSEVVGEILRLGNDRQSFRWISDGEYARALLRVVGPPYYAMLRALDRRDDEGPVAYVERAPRVWVEVGYAHPLADRLRPPAGQILLLRPPRRWMALDEAPFRDIYEALEFPVPRTEVGWHPAELARRISVPLRLDRGGPAEAAELWVLGDDGPDQLDELVRGADDELVRRLSFAVGRDGDRRTVVVRVRPSKKPPPVLVLRGVGFRPYLRLPNLFLPCGSRLHPPLRRDAIAKLLAGDPGRLTWLAPTTDGTFRPESLPDEAFRPLDQWVDYVLDHDHRALEAWVEATRFDFEPFVCRDDPPAPPAAPQRGGRKARSPRPEMATAPADEKDEEATYRATDLPRQTDHPPAIGPGATPGALERHLSELEARFLELSSPLDADDRRELWRQIATANAALGRSGEATLCWANAVWEFEAPPPSWLREWSDSEGRGRRSPLETVADLERLLAGMSPDRVADLRALASSLVRSAFAERPPAELRSRLGTVQHVLEQHEAMLPVRLAWLSWMALMHLSRGDVLALARARDRMLERLHHQGLAPDLDLPGFLRASGGMAGGRGRSVGDHLLRLRAPTQSWLGEGMVTAPFTGPLADLMFAFGLARLGDAAGSRKLVREAAAALEKRDPLTTWFHRAFEHRIDQVIEGKVAAGQLPRKLLDALDVMEPMSRYKADRLRQHSRIIEPHEKIDAYRAIRRFRDDLSPALNALYDVRDRGELADRLTRLLGRKRDGSGADRPEVRLFGTALELAPRLGEAFARDLLGRVAKAIDRLPDLRDRAVLLEKALHLALHFDQRASVASFVGRFHEMLADRRGDETLHAVEPLLGQCFRGLRKLGMRDEIGRLLGRMAELVLEGRGVAAGSGAEATDPLRFTAERRGPGAGEWGRALRLLLHVAAGWSYFGQDDRARHILDEARDLLLEGDLAPVDQTKLACGYIDALGQTPVEVALPRLEELLPRLGRVHDTYTTSTHYSLSRLNVVESLVLALAGDAMALDQAGRRWLDDDEYLVRRRIHRDVRAAMGQEG
jgi:hypothetical protein